jgi:uncharacterized protein with PhoU and TrkA domain
MLSQGAADFGVPLFMGDRRMLWTLLALQSFATLVEGQSYAECILSVANALEPSAEAASDIAQVKVAL